MRRDCTAGAGPRESDARLNGDPGAARPCRSTLDHTGLRAPAQWSAVPQSWTRARSKPSPGTAFERASGVAERHVRLHPPPASATLGVTGFDCGSSPCRPTVVGQQWSAKGSDRPH